MIDISTRLPNHDYDHKIMTSDAAAALIHPGDVVAVSGFTPAGCPKVVPLALAERIGKEHFTVDIMAGSSLGDEIDGALARVHGVRRRYSYQSNKDLRRQVNDGSVAYDDCCVSKCAQYIRTGRWPHMDVAIVEAAAITADGNLIPTTGIGLMQTIIDACDNIIVEVNVTQPLGLMGMHDVYSVAAPPHSVPIPITHAGDRIGKPYVLCGWDKIRAIVPSDRPETPRSFKPVDENAKKMGHFIVDFFRQEIKKGRLPKNLLPLQSGVGSVSNAVISTLAQSEFNHLSIYTEVLQDGMLALIDAGKADAISTASISTSPEGLKHFYENLDQYRDKIVIRPQEISNNPEVACRLGTLAMNTAIEFDIYGNVNSTHILGTKIMNGIGGSCDFARASYLSIFCTASTMKDGAIGCVVPMCSHIDQTEHDVDILVTEQGLADLRGLSPIERARTIIANCAHPDYKAQLTDYLDRAITVTGSAHTPHILAEALSWHQRYAETGSMKKKAVCSVAASKMPGVATKIKQAIDA